MRFAIYATLCVLLGLASLTMLYAAIQNARQRWWKGAALLALAAVVLAGASANLYDVAVS